MLAIFLVLLVLDLDPSTLMRGRANQGRERVEECWLLVKNMEGYYFKIRYLKLVSELRLGWVINKLMGIGFYYFHLRRC